MNLKQALATIYRLSKHTDDEIEKACHIIAQLNEFVPCSCCNETLIHKHLADRNHVCSICLSWNGITDRYDKHDHVKK